MRDNPSLMASLPDSIAEAYGDAVIEAARETDLPGASFPTICPWPFEQFMDQAFSPDQVD